MAKSNGKLRPAKPRSDFPLYAHASGKWAKKVRGKLYYFGKWNDPQAALKEWLEAKDDLLAGRKPRAKQSGPTIRNLVNRFLTTKRSRVDSGELTPTTWKEYRDTCGRVINAFGAGRRLDDLKQDDFEKLRATYTKTLGPTSTGNEIGRARVLFKFAYDEGLIDHPIRYGQGFKRPSRKTLRQVRAARGSRMFEAVELRAILAAAKQPMRAMILLGANCGFGQTDIANLPISAIDLEAGWVDYPRPKTGIDRRCPLWQKTVDAIQEALKVRPASIADEESGLAFLTCQGRKWVRLNENETPNDEIGKQFAKLLRSLKLKRPGVSFYALRHGFETIAGGSRDQVAVDALMGHAREDMASLYRERIDDARLLAVSNYVHDWLFSGK